MPHTLVLSNKDTTTKAWLQAVKALDKNSKHAYNLVYSVIKPEQLTGPDKEVVRIFNEYALKSGLHTTDTVANTIFPVDTFRSKGSTEFYDFYLQSIFPKVRKQWGTYFERMICRRNDDGSMMQKDGTRLNPLHLLIKKIERRIQAIGKTKTHYELALDDPIFDLATYDAHHDGAYQIGGPCLSHLSFKIDSSGALNLTAFYRSHWYIARALGNLIGLARLQSFVAHQSKANIGVLTIVASEAQLDLSANGRRTADARKMIADCEAIYGAS